MLWVPKPYQTPMREFAVRGNSRANIFVGMGAGKTVAIASAINDLRVMDGRPWLIWAPKSVALNTWPAEFAKWDHLKHLRVRAIVGSAKERGDALTRGDADVYTTNYDNAEWLLQALGRSRPFAGYVADESTRLQSFRLKRDGRTASGTAKHHKSGKRAQAVAEFAKDSGGWLNASGTPTLQGLDRLWGPQWMIDQGYRLGRTFSDFQMRFFRPKKPDPKAPYKKVYGSEPHETAEKEIMAAIADCTIAIDPKDYMPGIPPLIESEVFVELTGAARRVYVDMEKKMYAEVASGKITAQIALAKAVKLMQIANGAVLMSNEDGSQSRNWEAIHEEKLDALDSVMEESGGAPVLVAYQFQSDRERILKRFKFARPADSKGAIEDFMAGRLRMLIGHPKSIGHGLSLQAHCWIGCSYSTGWSMENEAQIRERIGPVRQYQSGHPRTVYWRSIVAKDTVDEDLVLNRNSKLADHERFMEGLKRRNA
jgi:SNF2 family DNA or RNA helicase